MEPSPELAAIGETMAVTEEQALTPGTRIDSFQVELVLGVGGFGITYRAHDESLQRRVALKEYFPSGLAARRENDTTIEPRTRSDHESYSYGLKRFLDEARTLAKFQNRNIVRVNSFLEANGTAYLVMDYEEGRSLAEVLKQVGTLDRRQATAVAVHILRGLREVHAKGILHRDIKPGNIFVGRSGPPVLLDFGAARQALERQAGDVTVMLTPGYAPIEQYGGEDRLGPWSDIYALGATLFHALTGRAPMQSTQRVSMVQDGQPDSVALEIEAVAHALGPTLTRAVSWMLAMNSRERPQTASQALELLLPGRAADTASGGKTRAPPPAGQEPSEATTQRASAPAHSTELLAAAEKALAEYLGPIAKVLVERVAKTAPNADALYDALAAELEDEDERRAFLASKR